MNTRLLIVCFAMAAMPAAALGQEKPNQETKIDEDRARIRKSLRTMDEISPELRRRRLTIVKDEGISGLDSDAKPPRPGDLAPDFELRPLKFYRFKTEETDITQENADLLYKPVRLSEFRGKRPVVLIFGSYT